MSAPVAQAAIEIQAPIALVFAILLDFAAYPKWNPFILEVTNMTPENQPIAVDTEFTLYCKYSDNTTSTSREKVTQVTPPDEATGGRAVLANRFAGPIAALGIVKGTRYQWLEQDVAGGVTRYRTREMFTGLGAALVPRAQVEDGFVRMAKALKARAESKVTAP